jgi:hypothetical protein
LIGFNDDNYPFHTLESEQVGGAVGSQYDVRNTCVQGWSGTLGGVGNNGSNPLFADRDGADNVEGTPDDDLTLLAGSPAVDSGDMTLYGGLTGATSTDLGGNPRAVDDPAAADTGAGVPPWLDRGAYERQAPLCGNSDFNGDGDIGTDADIEAFFACLAGDCCAMCWPGGSDFNGDGDLGTDADIEAFFRVLGGGEC